MLLHMAGTAVQGKNLQVLCQSAGAQHRRDFGSIENYLSFLVMESQERESRL